MCVSFTRVTTSTRFAFSWTNQPTQTNNGLEVLPPVGKPLNNKNLGWRQLDAKLADCKKYNRGNDWAYTVWVSVNRKYRRLTWTRNDVEWWLSQWRCYGQSQCLEVFMPLEL